MVVLRPLTAENKCLIRRWPSYSGLFGEMSYALRKGGWLDEFSGQPEVLSFVAEIDGEVVGFSLLIPATRGEAEFRVALHPHWTGRGLGEEVTRGTLKIGFEERGLCRIQLIVRKSNAPAFRLYQRVGFVVTGECIRDVQGKNIDFIQMEIRPDVIR
ncbi:MAG: GNAT family N-acetyltransferase [Nitrospinae bacterium]|nr:GNAT family N-acetyltransferase [Nitrospinota bacterium]